LGTGWLYQPAFALNVYHFSSTAPRLSLSFLPTFLFNLQPSLLGQFFFFLFVRLTTPSSASFQRFDSTQFLSLAFDFSHLIPTFDSTNFAESDCRPASYGIRLKDLDEHFTSTGLLARHCQLAHLSLSFHL
jgi:hypothetical protein